MISIARMSLLAGTLIVGAAAAVTLWRAAEPCPGTLQSVTYDVPPGGLHSLQFIAKINRAKAGASDEFGHWEDVTTTLGRFRIRFKVFVARIQSTSSWGNPTRIYDAELCPNNEIEIELPEHSVECPDVGLYYDQAEGVYVVVYDNKNDAAAYHEPWPYQHRNNYHDTVVGAFRRDDRPVRFYLSRDRGLQLIVFGVAVTGLVLAWARLLRAERSHHVQG